MNSVPIPRVQKILVVITLTFLIFTGELYTVACSPTDPLLVATGGGDDKGYLWRIGQGDWAQELRGKLMRLLNTFVNHHSLRG